MDASTSAVNILIGTGQVKVFLVANDDAIGDLIGGGVYDPGNPDAIVVCSRKIADEQQRSPSGRYRDGSLGARYVSLGPMLSEAQSVDDLRDAFGKAVGL